MNSLNIAAEKLATQEETEELRALFTQFNETEVELLRVKGELAAHLCKLSSSNLTPREVDMLISIMRKFA